MRVSTPGDGPVWADEDGDRSGGGAVGVVHVTGGVENLIGPVRERTLPVLEAEAADDDDVYVVDEVGAGSYAEEELVQAGVLVAATGVAGQQDVSDPRTLTPPEVPRAAIRRVEALEATAEAMTSRELRLTAS